MLEAKSTEELYVSVVRTKKRGAFPLLLLIGAAWCSPCRYYKPLVAKEVFRFDRLDLMYYDLDRGPVKGFPLVRGIPVLMLVRKGKVVKILEGASPVESLREWLRVVIHAGRGRRKRL